MRNQLILGRIKQVRSIIVLKICIKVSFLIEIYDDSKQYGSYSNILGLKKFDLQENSL
jgi:hypothetical protein